MSSYSFPLVTTKAELIRIVNQRKNYAQFDQPYDRLEFAFANGTTEYVRAKQGNVTSARVALTFIGNDNESLLQGRLREAGNEFRIRDAVEPRGGVTLIVHFAD